MVKTLRVIVVKLDLQEISELDHLCLGSSQSLLSCPAIVLLFLIK